MFPVAVAVTNFTCDANVAYVMRALSCFGGGVIHIIGKVPKTNELKRLSGGHSELIKIESYKRPEDFIAWKRKTDAYVITADLIPGAINLHEAVLPIDRNVVFVVGNEMEGIPVEITKTADMSVYIPMPGTGFCLNTSQSANVLLYEYSKRVLTGNNKPATVFE